MKKFWTLLLVAPIALALNACGPQDNTAADAQEAIEQTAENAVDSVSDAAADAKAAVEEAVDNAKEAVEEKLDEAKESEIIVEETTEEVVEEAPATDAEFDNINAPASAE